MNKTTKTTWIKATKTTWIKRKGGHYLSGDGRWHIAPHTKAGRPYWSLAEANRGVDCGGVTFHSTLAACRERARRFDLRVPATRCLADRNCVKMTQFRGRCFDPHNGPWLGAGAIVTADIRSVVPC